MNNAPNLDAMTDEELKAFSASGSSRERARELFPDRPKGYVKATYQMTLYAFYLLKAREHRASGETGVAIMYEENCQSIYRRFIPMFARWRRVDG